MSLHIISAGIGDTKYLTQTAKEKIENSDLIIGAKRIIEPYIAGKKYFYEYNSDKISELLNNISYKNAAVLFSGDASFFSGAKNLTSIYPDADVEAGISSAAYFCAKTGISRDNFNILSLHGRKCNIVSNVRRNRKSFVLLGNNPCHELCKFNLGNVKVIIGENLSYPNEKIYSGTASDFRDTKLPALSVMVIENENADSRVRTGIDDDEFIRGSVPMTKSAVRAVTLSKLDIRPNDICYDIGAGTGSVSVESALAAYNGTVYSVEKNPEAAKLVNANAVKFRCDNIKIIEGTAPDAINGLPKPDRVFIGGSSGTLKEIIEKCCCDLIVVNAATLETLTGTLKAFDELGYDCTTEQISVSYIRKIAGYNMLTSHNPVFIITGKRGTVK